MVCCKNWIIYESSYVHTPQQNGYWTQKRHLLEIANTLLVNHPFSCCFLHNHYFIFPLLIFNYVCFMHNVFMVLDNLSPHSTRCVLIKYSHTYKNYRHFDPDTRKFIICADGTFFDSVSTSPSISCKHL